MNLRLLKMPWLLMTVLLALSSCATTLHDYTFCNPLSSTDQQRPGGANCNDFYNAHPQQLDKIGYINLLASWVSAGYAIEVTNSKAVSDIKSELEKLCSEVACNQDAVALRDKILSGINRVEKTAATADQRDLGYCN